MDKQLRNSKAIIRQILEDYPICRDSDSFLELQVLSVYARNMGNDVDNMTVVELFLHRDKWGFPKPETIRRNRQKLQQHHPELAPSENVAKHRRKNEKKVRDYVREAKYEA